MGYLYLSIMIIIIGLIVTIIIMSKILKKRKNKISFLEAKERYRKENNKKLEEHKNEVKKINKEFFEMEEKIEQAETKEELDISWDNIYHLNDKLQDN